MSNIGSYTTRSFSESQKFLVLDPSTGSTSLVLGSDIVNYITPSLNFVYAESTRLAAENTDYQVGSLIQTSGATSVGDNLASVYLVVAGGTGDFPMINGNDLLVISGDDNLRADLISTDAGKGSDLVTYTTTGQLVTEAIDERVIRASSISEIEALAGVSDYQVSLSGQREGIFEFDSSNLSAQVTSDVQQGVYIAPASDPTGASGAWVRQYSGPVNVSWFGAVGDGVANDWPQTKAAFDFCKTNTKAVEFNADETYYLGAFPDSGQEIKYDIDVDGMRIETNGCTFLVDVSLLAAPASSDQVLFQNTQASNTWVGDFEVIGDQIQKNPSRIGFIAFNIHNENANSSNITLGNIKATKALAAIQATTADPALFRHGGVKCGLVSNLDGYYGINCANNADGFDGFSIYTESAVRSYFVYGVSDHKGIVRSQDHAEAADVLLARYERDTSNIDLIYTAINDLSPSSSFRCAFVTNDTDAKIKNVNVLMDVEKATPADGTITFIAFDAGSIQQTTTTNEFENINLSGRTNSIETTVLTLSTAMTGDAQSTITIDKELFKTTQDTKGYIFNSGENQQIAFADATTDLELDFKIRGVYFTVPQIARVCVAAFDNGTSNTGEYFAEEFWVRFRIASDGTVTISNTQTISQFTGGALGPTLTVANQPAGTYSLKVKVNNYTNANRVVKGTLELFAYAEAL